LNNKTPPKNNKLKKILFLAFCFISIFFISCEKEGNETVISQYLSSESHNFGNNCMECHQKGGEGEGWFTVAGSVSNADQTSPYPNATVELTTLSQNTGTVIKTIEVDTKGNFYTTENISFGSGLYVTVKGQNGEVQHMLAPITSGECNLCHGSTTPKIWIN